MNDTDSDSKRGVPQLLEVIEQLAAREYEHWYFHHVTAPNIKASVAAAFGLPARLIEPPEIPPDAEA